MKKLTVDEKLMLISYKLNNLYAFHVSTSKDIRTLQRFSDDILLCANNREHTDICSINCKAINLINSMFSEWKIIYNKWEESLKSVLKLDKDSAKKIIIDNSDTMIKELEKMEKDLLELKKIREAYKIFLAHAMKIITNRANMAIVESHIIQHDIRNEQEALNYLIEQVRKDDIERIEREKEYRYR